MAAETRQQAGRYPAYQPTGVEWMPEIPAGWVVKKLKTFIADLESGVSVNSFDEPVTDEEIGILKTSCVYRYTFDFEENKKVLAEEIDRVRVPVRGDTLIISRMNTPDLVGASGYVESDIPNLFLPDRLWQTVFKTDAQIACFPKWLSYVFVSPSFRMLISSLATGTSPSMKNISKEEILNIQVGLPSWKEQQAIARFLDDKTAQIDQLIVQKQQMLELLREERAALLNHAVTKGLDAAAPLRDSGVEWLGEVPAHWEVKRLKHLTTKIGSGVTPKGGAEVYQKEGIPILRSQNIHFDGLRLDDVAFIEDEVHQSMSNSRVLPGDVLLNITGASIGRCFFADTTLGEANVNQHVCIVRPNALITTEFLWAALSTELGQEQILVSQNGSGREGLNFESLKKFVIGLPPLHEQQLITAYITAKSAEVKRTTATINQEIALLQEYRAALIAEAVTGQLDVRHYAPAPAVLM